MAQTHLRALPTAVHGSPSRTSWSRVAACQALAVALALLVPSAAWAGGAGLYEIGTPDLGTASAGRAATANDASTAFGNPAGMTRLQEPQLLGGMMIYQMQTFFDPERPPSTASGGAGGNAGGFSPLPAWGGWAPPVGLYAVYGLSDDLKLGFSSNSYVAGSFDYDSDWIGRYYVQRVDILTLNFNPAIAYRITPWLSVGAGFSVQYAKIVQKVAINNVLDRVGDGRLTVRSASVGFGGNAGVLVEASPSTRFGVTYRSQVDQDFEDTATASNLGPLLRASLDARGLSGLPVDLSLTIPQEVMVSAYHDITPEVAIMANFVWQNWAEFGKPELSVSTESITVDQEYEDTYGLAVGSHLRVADPLLLQLGFAYDTSATSDSHRSPAFSVDEQYRWAVGLQYERDESLTFGIAYELFYMSNAPIDQTRTVAGTLKGDYSTNFIHFFGLTLSKKF